MSDTRLIPEFSENNIDLTRREPYRDHSGYGVIDDETVDKYYQPLVGYLKYIALALEDLGASEAEVTELLPIVAAFASAACGKAALSGQALQLARRLVRRGERNEAVPERAFPTVGKAKTIQRLVQTYKARRDARDFLDETAEVSDRVRAAGRFVGTFSRLRKQDPEAAAQFAEDSELRQARQLLDLHRPKPRRSPMAPSPA